MATIDIQAIIDEWGARYTNEGQTARDIKTQLFAPSETEAFFRNVPTTGDYYKSSFATVDEVTQAFSIPFVPKGTLSFEPWETRLGEYKVDQLMTPDRFRNSWLGFLAQIEEVDRSKWPVLVWYVREMLLPKIAEEQEEEQSYWGWQKTGFRAVSPVVNGATYVREFTAENAVTPANAAVDGIHTIIAKMRTANRCTVNNSGAWSTDPVEFVTQIENWIQAIEPKLRRKLDYLFMSEVLKNRYVDGRREKYNKYYAQESDLLVIDKVNMKVQSLHSMVGAGNHVWATPAANRIRPISKDSDARFDVQKFDRSVKMLNDWKKVSTFDVPEFVVTNDQGGVITSGLITERYS
jgi:hypothetical protein